MHMATIGHGGAGSSGRNERRGLPKWALCVVWFCMGVVAHAWFAAWVAG